jgi:hypothetical protein
MKTTPIVLLLTASAGFFPPSVSALHQHSSAACRASTVQYRTGQQTPRGVVGVPWIASSNSAFRGYLFYWGGTPWMRTRPHAVRIFTTKARVKTHPKVLWVALKRSGTRLTIRGRRLDGPGSFGASYPAAIGGGQFPSYVSVPTAGCWRVAVRSGSVYGSVTFLAADKL